MWHWHFWREQAVYFVEFSLLLGLSDISSQLDSDYALLAGIPQKWCVLLGTSYHEVHDVNMSHYCKIRHKFKIIFYQNHGLLNTAWKGFNTHSRFFITGLLKTDSKKRQLQALQMLRRKCSHLKKLQCDSYEISLNSFCRMRAVI